ncbi:hypothetical protein AWM70_13210 [Paenibacillus yonginensis]|uniref:Uncharacterized protein n=1 Tax=Paenibacillus yonginensis TaxID=1462996 RepID=A0A1B1N207_9BACL|nr:hypothetical protein [Paenibacillus yonginensis]ANS75448.1 hypothetical protein AWM70_13210 [Paenibacillus yonginensis]
MDLQNQDINQYINGISQNIGRIADSVTIKLTDTTNSIQSLDGTLKVTNILLGLLAVISIANFILKLKRK